MSHPMTDLWLPPTGKRASPSLLNTMVPPHGCPALCWYEMTTPQPETDAMLRGKVEHCLLLEPFAFDLRYRWAPEGRRGTKAWDAAEADAKDAGLTLIPAHWRPELEGMATAVMAHKDAGPLLRTRVTEELRLEWTDSATGVGCVCVIDGYCPPVIFDLKTVANSSPYALNGALKSRGYCIQMAMQFDALLEHGYDEVDVVILAVRSTAPHLVCVGQIDEASIAYGRESYRTLLHLWRQCWEADDWPDYGWQMLSLPRYALAEQENVNGF